MPRLDGRTNNEMRPVTLTSGYMKYAEGSCLVEFGETKVICTASVEDRVPPHKKGSGEGWVTAEYSMLPRANRERNMRETRGPGGRSMEIQRLIARSLRSVVELNLLGERTITLDCDVLQGDGGTRTAAITGAYVALAEAAQLMVDERMIKRMPISGMVAAVSVGIVNGEEMLDLFYDEDKIAAVDMNVVMTEKGRFVEVQGTAEGVPFDRVALNRLLDLAHAGIQKLHKLQRQALEDLR